MYIQFHLFEIRRKYIKRFYFSTKNAFITSVLDIDVEKFLLNNISMHEFLWGLTYVI